MDLKNQTSNILFVRAIILFEWIYGKGETFSCPRYAHLKSQKRSTACLCSTNIFSFSTCIALNGRVDVYTTIIRSYVCAAINSRYTHGIFVSSAGVSNKMARFIRTFFSYRIGIYCVLYCRWLYFFFFCFSIYLLFILKKLLQLRSLFIWTEIHAVFMYKFIMFYIYNINR